MAANGPQGIKGQTWARHLGRTQKWCNFPAPLTGKVPGYSELRTKLYTIFEREPSFIHRFSMFCSNPLHCTGKSADVFKCTNSFTNCPKRMEMDETCLQRSFHLVM